jgi:hypothetical protein
MRRQHFIVLMFASLISAVSTSHAGDTQVDFDKGKDHSGIVETARKQKNKRWAKPLDKIKEFSTKFADLDNTPRPNQSAPTTPTIAPMVSTAAFFPPSAVACDQMPPSSDDPGGSTPALCGKKRRSNAASSPGANVVPITGPYEPLPRDDKDYQDAVWLKSQIDGIGAVNGVPNAKASIPPAVRDALLNRWPPLYSKRSDLIAQARPLDADDEALSRFAYRLNVWLDNIKRRKSLLDSQGAQYDSGCLGRPLPEDEYRQCESYRLRFNNCVAGHNASLNERTRLADAWYQGKSCLTTRGNSFRARVTDWVIGLVRPWVADARAALAKACDPLISVAATATPPTILPRRTSTLNAEPKYSNSGPDSKPCPTQYKWKPAASNMGFLNSSTDQSVTFTSSGERGRQDFRVEASDDFSTKIDGVIVTVAGGTLCPVTRTYDPTEDKTTCVYQCSIPTTPLTVPGNVPCPQIFEP